ncbi:hypothetical protein MFIFM68171_07332 [Madurella fahalii]|uniref:Uncharacterized protein n=1 Tax=Madurella fahalii TaxID=1157608 RepID=A0ABQ0GH72_9PEZI
MSRYGCMANCANPCRPGNRVNVTCIGHIITSLQKDLEFRSSVEVHRWLKSDEVRPFWGEFKRDYLAHNPVRIRTERPFQSSRNFKEPVFTPNLTEIEMGLHDSDNVARLRADFERRDKGCWSVTDHIAWFCHQVYYQAWRNKSAKSLLPHIREPRGCDDGNSPYVFCGDFAYILVALVHIEVRQPDWVFEREFENEEREATYGAMGSLLLDQLDQES